jgi:hypothetical protein
MNSKPNVPAEIFLGNQEYSWRIDWTVNGWLFAATIISGLSDIMFPQVVNAWPLPWKVMIVLAQFLAISLWAGRLAGWIRGMDEMHRRITMAAVLFAIGGTFFVIMLWHRLESAGLFHALSSSVDPSRGSWDIATVSHAFLLLTLFYFLGHRIFNRRYQ